MATDIIVFHSANKCIHVSNSLTLIVINLTLQKSSSVGTTCQKLHCCHSIFARSQKCIIIIVKRYVSKSVACSEACVVMLPLTILILDNWRLLLCWNITYVIKSQPSLIVIDAICTYMRLQKDIRFNLFHVLWQKCLYISLYPVHDYFNVSRQQ